jgi:hypothetical protein
VERAPQFARDLRGIVYVVGSRGGPPTLEVGGDTVPTVVLVRPREIDRNAEREEATRLRV